MTAPTRAEWGSCWLGRYTDPAADGWLPIREPVQDAQLAVFERKVTIGDASKDTDDYISSWVMGDWSGGGQIEDINESSDANRFWWAVAETRSPHRVALPPLVVESRPSDLGETEIYPLGMINSSTSIIATTAVAFNTAVYGYEPVGDTWTAAAATALAAAPVRKGTRFKGTGTTIPTLYVPFGNDGWASIIAVAGTGRPIVTNSASHSFVSFCVFNDTLFGVNTIGLLYQTVNGTTWTNVQDFVQSNTRIAPHETPIHLVSYFNRSGEPTLYLVTNQSAWAIDLDAGRGQQTALQFPRHRYFGRAAAIFRPGEDLWIGAGMDTIRYTSANVIVPLAGPARDDGVPSGRLGFVADLEPELSCLYATVAKTTGGGSLMAWTGTGWHGMLEFSDTPMWSYVAQLSANNSYHLIVGVTGSHLHVMKLRESFHNPKQGVLLGTDTFAASGYIETGRFDANMLGFRKVASHVSVFMDNATATETLVVKYRTDASQASFPAEGAWTTLGTITAIGLTQIAFDPNADGFNEGQSFNWIQFRFEFARGATTSTSPLLNAFVLHFTKVPQNTPSFAFDLVLPVETSVGATGDEMTDRLNELTEADEYLCFVVRDRRYRVRIAGMSGNRATGEDGSGARKVSLIAIPEGL